MDILLFLAFFFLLTYVIGRLLERFRIPWLFSALLIGLMLSIANPFTAITNSPIFLFLSNLGMFFLLFIIGFEVDIKKIFSHERFIIKGAIAVILAETIVGTLILHYFFHIDLLIAVIVASSFSTVGEAVLLPILDEFNMTNSKVGRCILGIGILDDVVEIGVIVASIAIISRTAGHSQVNIWATLLLLGASFGLVFLLVKFHRKIHIFRFKDIPSFFLLILFFIFLFVGFGRFVEAGSLGSILAGIALKNLLSKENIRYVDSEIRIMSYGFLAPIFFLWVGLNTDLHYLSQSLWMVAFVIITISSTKIFVSYLVAHKELGKKKSIIIGVGLCVKLSTSIVILKLFLDQGLIGSEPYSVLIASSILFTIIVPLVLPWLISKWRVHLTHEKV